MDLEISEGKFSVKILEREDLSNAYKLRYKIFCEELSWLPLNPDCEEKDHHDEKAVHFGVFNNGNIIGYCRVILPQEIFMAEENFRDLIDGGNFTKEIDMIEISRLGIYKEYRNSIFFGNIDMLLYKMIYLWSLKNNIRYWFMVVRPEYLESIKKILPCKQISEIKYYQETVGTTAAVIDLREAENYVLRENPSLYEWFSPK